MKRVDSGEYSIKYFKNYCTGYEVLVGSHGKKMDQRLEMILKLAQVKPGMVIVDYGCGRGELAHLVAEMGAKTYGFDYSKKAIEFSKKFNCESKAKYILINEPKLPFKDRGVDIIFLADVIEHLYEEEVELVLAEFKRVLKRKGKLIIHTAPNREFYDVGYVYWTRWISLIFNYLWILLFKERLITVTNPRDDLEKKLHVNELSAAELKKVLIKAGFGEVRVWYDSEFRKVRKRDKIRFLLLQPAFGFLKRYFALDIWAIARVV